ncbi:hypothetical protein PULV_a0220 [Pseudoalteromonas ulvae UL12]|uniref:acyltransferase family protein n=1 Tax=Pseudoalteromonas ulvae TaxID=107327 RepID=UPI00186B9DAB|nr:acyltransferase [Pseudoalteromonas ulvae]MBE0362681.1 hypothetical protein [Pseudoalteromonas ulvae UL12]
MHNRTDWIDYCKAIGIILVVYGHVVRGLLKAGINDNLIVHQYIDSVIYTFHMPLFFFLSGLFYLQTLHKYGAAGLLNKKIDTLFYMYVVWSLLQGGIEVALSQFTNNTISLSEVVSLLIEPRMQFWFLYALIMLFVLTTFIYKVIPKLPASVLIGVSALLYIYAAELPQGLNSYFIYQNLIFFTLGIGVYQLNDLRMHFNMPIFIALIGAFITSQYLFHLNHTYQDRGFYSLITATIAISMVVQAALGLMRFELRWLKLIGVYSLSIYLIHILTGSGIRVVLTKVLTVDNFYIHLMCGLLFGLLFPMIIQYGVEKNRLRYIFSAPISKLWRT